MKTTSIVVVLILMLAIAATAEIIGKVSNNEVQTVTLPVYHDTTGRADADLTIREKHFLSTIPNADGLRDAVREMVLANVVHVPVLKCGNYSPGDSVHFWSIYQAWTGPAKVRVPVTVGIQGQPGPRGPQGSQGPPGQGTSIFNFSTAPIPSAMVGGTYPAMRDTYSVGSIDWVHPDVINIDNDVQAIANAWATASATQWQKQGQNQWQKQDQNQEVAIDP